MRVLLALLFVMLAAKAVADERQIRRDCTSDALSYCSPEIPKGRKAIIRCMVKNKDSLSAACRRHIT